MPTTFIAADKKLINTTADDIYKQMLGDVHVENSKFHYTLMQLIAIDEAREDLQSTDCFIHANYKKKFILKVKGQSRYYFEKLAQSLIKNDVKEGFLEGIHANAVHFYETYERYISEYDGHAEEDEFQFSFSFKHDVITVSVATDTFSLGVRLFNLQAL